MRISKRILQMGGKYLLLFLVIVSGTEIGISQENDSGKVIIRSGLTGVAGYSQLYLHDEVRPPLLRSAYYKFHPNLFVKVGALIVVHPTQLGDRIQFVFDPTFSKFSYGDIKSGYQITDSVSSIADLDFESLDFPLSIRYGLLPTSARIQPFLRLKYTYAFFVDTDGYLASKIEVRGEAIQRFESGFDFANYQQFISLSFGADLHLQYVDYLIEVGIDLGDGIHAHKHGADYLRISRTTGFYLQFGVLF